MKLNSSHLMAFYCVAKTLNFTRAAEEIFVTQSALSQRIAKLEEDLETTLFIRDRNSVKLTEAGFQLLRYCQTNEMAEGEILSVLKGSKDTLGGTIRIGGFSSVNRSLVIPAFKKIMQENSNLSIQLITRELGDLEDLLRRTEVDYILMSKASTSPDIESIFLGYEENVLVTSKKHPENNIFLDHDEGDPTTTSYFKQNKINFQTSQKRYLDDVYGLIDGVKNGYGKAVLPKHLIQDEKDLKIIDPKKILKVSVYLQFFRQPFYRKIHPLVIKELTNHFQKELAQ
jgi:DNA-binding transcriptional LysR family regulator